MNTPPRFEQQLSDWLADGPVDAPDTILDTVLAAFPSIPQRRGALRVPWRTPSTNGYSRLVVGLAAVVAIAAGALFVVPRLQPSNVGAPPSAPLLTSSPSPSLPAPSPSPSPVPSTSPSVAVAAQECMGSDLAAQVMSWLGAAGTRYGTIQVTNMAATSCTVRGTPGIQLVDGQGHVFLDSANLGAPASVTPTDPVFTSLAGGANSIYLMAGLSNYCGAAPTSPVRMALVLPISLGRVVATLPAGVIIAMAPCNGPGAPTTLHVQMPWSTTAP